MSKRLPQTEMSSYFVKRNRTDPDTQPVSSIYNEESQTLGVESLEVEDSSVSITDSSSPRIVATESNTNEGGRKSCLSGTYQKRVRNQVSLSLRFHKTRRVDISVLTGIPTSRG